MTASANPTPEISLIVPVYNTEEYLVRCLNSIVGQSITQFEALCVDDGSTDRSPEILQEYARKDARILVITQTNQGLSCARNRALAEARGEFLVFVDSDDFLPPNALEILYRAMTDEFDIVCGSHLNENRSANRTRQWSLPRRDLHGLECLASILRKVPLWTAWAKLYRRRLFLPSGRRFPPELRRMEDVITISQVFHDARAARLLPDCVYHRVQRPGSLSTTLDQTGIELRLKSRILLFEFMAQQGLTEHFRDELAELADTALKRPLKRFLFDARGNSPLSIREIADLYRQNLPNGRLTDSDIASLLAAWALKQRQYLEHCSLAERRQMARFLADFFATLNAIDTAPLIDQEAALVAALRRETDVDLLALTERIQSGYIRKALRRLARMVRLPGK